jgi:predicted aspartyl protease
MLESASAGVGPCRSFSFQLSAEGDIVVAATVQGAGPFRFLLDTGSSRSAVSAEVAARLKLRTIAQTTILTAAGEGLRPLAQLNGLSIGPASPAMVLAMVAPANELARSVPVDGIIGQDVLARFAYTIDYRRRQLVWHASTSEEISGTRLAMESEGGRLRVLLPQASRAQRVLRMIPDTGADGIVFFERAHKALPPVTPLDTVGLKTLSGVRVVRRVLIDCLDVGKIRLKDQVGMIVAAGDNSLRGDGLLPLHLFARVTFNGPGGYLAVEAD